MVTAPQPVQLTDWAGSLRRHWPVVIMSAVIGLIVGVLVSFIMPSSFDATATVSVNPMNADSFSASDDVERTVSMPTEVGLASSAQVAATASKTLRPDESMTAADVRSSTGVESPDGSFILNIQFSGDTAKRAAAGANAVAEAYLSTRRDAAEAEVERLVASAQEQIAAVQASANLPENGGPLQQRALGVQADVLGTKAAELGNIDLDPGRVLGDAEVPRSPSTPGAVPLGLAGLLIGLLAGVPIALVRRDENSDIGGVEGLQAIGDQIVLDGTKDTNRDDTWNIAAFMLKIPTDIGIEDSFVIMVDAEEEPGRAVTAGQELVEALARRGRSARFVDAGAINEGKISRGWPTDRKRESWAGEIIVIDTTTVTSHANKVALATRSDSVLLARITTDDSMALRRLASLLKSKSIDIALTALFPPRSAMLTSHR